MPAELIPLEAGQHSVVLVPKATTDLPFFWLTKRQASLREDIAYQGTDAEGRPIRWAVTPNRSPKIGPPGIEAHEVWMRLVKPVIDSRLNLQDKTTYVIPLGRVRQCLRVIGWSEGGFEARRFLKALRQIGAAWCIADLWIPTTQTDEQGNVLFSHIKGEFSKMTIYAIGSKHLTEEELNSEQFKFDFNLDDTVYILLNPIEAEIQKNQPQRYIDNQYMFSVGPASQRWYELLAAKIFGVIKNNGSFCEIRYSWYVKHHHTLKRFYTRKRVVFQMTRLVQDHLDSGYLAKVEYRALKEPDQEIDWIIRYYPGEAARTSIARILSYQHRQRPTGIKERISTRTRRPRLKKLLHPEQEIDERLVAELTNRGVTASEAAKIVAGLDLGPDEYLTDILDWADYLIGQAPAGKIYNPSGFYVHLVKERAFPPATFETSRKRRLRQEAQQVIAQRLQEEATIRLAYDDYLTTEIDSYVAQNAQQFQDILDARRQQLKTHKTLGLWSDETITKMALSAARSEMRKRAALLTLQAFIARYKAEELAAQLTRLLLPAPRLHPTDPARLGQGIDAPSDPGNPYFTI
jgi:hypothetical protein